MCDSFRTCLFLMTLTFTIVYGDKPIVETTHGLVEGKVFKTALNKVGYHGFLGIPYAQAPLKELRFLPPQPLKPWDDVLIAKKEKKSCAQLNTKIIKGQRLSWYGVEDCLYLDIFTPKTDTTLRPVIFFLYNHNLQGTYNKTRVYSPDFFIEEDVVVVTVEYRVSVFGFLSLEDDMVPGNTGLRDIVAALEWTKSNIERFGGDPNKITLMGSRGGAATVDLLLHSSAKHLFHAAILQGGTSWSPVYLHEDVRQRAFKLGEILERASSSNNKLLKELQDLPIRDMLFKQVQAAPADYFKENQRGIITFSPIVEKDPNGLITQYPDASHDKIDIPVMIGFNSKEGLEATAQYLQEPRYLSFVQKDFPFMIPIRVNFRFDPTKEICYKAVDEIKNFYFENGKVTLKSLPEHIVYIGDILTTYAVDQTAKAYSKRSSNSVYYYHFDYYSDLNKNTDYMLNLSSSYEDRSGAAAGDELCYLFYCPEIKENYVIHNDDVSEKMIMLKKMVKMWSNFAKYGNPTPDEDADLEGLKWPTYDLNEKKYLHIGKQIEVNSDLYKEKFEFWDNFIKKWENMAEDGLIPEDINTENTRDEL